jgi:solute:Na+ symporter, SSS family
MHGPPKPAAGLLILPLYFVVTILIGWLSRNQSRSANAYLNATRSLPLWIVTAAYLAANCGALEIVGLSAMAAQYGVQAFHFYWIGAIPAMVFLALWMMPVYRRSGVSSVPEYLEIRYGSNLRLLNACVLAITMLLLAGISLYAMAQTLQLFLGLSFAAGVSLCAGVVFVYVLLGGIKATIYNEVFQLIVMIAGIAPIAWHAFTSGTVHQLVGKGSHFHLWRGLPVASRVAPLDGVGVVFGLGFVLSFGYWCTDFVLMQRAFTVRTDAEARQVPLWAGFGKLFFSIIIVIAGLTAAQLIPELGHSQRFDQALPAIMTNFYGPTMLGLGLTALAASLMSGLAANISAFASLWTQDIYRGRIRGNESDRHYLTIGRIATAVAIMINALASYTDFLFSNLMEHVQLIFSIFAAPFWAIFLLGMTTHRTTERAAVVGFISGAAVGLLHLLAFARGWIFYGSVMSENFYTAIYSFSTALVLGWLISRFGENQMTHTQSGLVFQRKAGLVESRHILWILSLLLLVSCVALNLIWR